ncbi:MAG: hypothetical protein QM523_04215, partial [Candidatus Pacebacteria bacterium]|nr:hypothetical protein [Candidatus Paceibacterota bacterium]
GSGEARAVWRQPARSETRQSVSGRSGEHSLSAVVAPWARQNEPEPMAFEWVVNIQRVLMNYLSLLAFLLTLFASE